MDKMIIDTPAGELVIEANRDATYPGVWISMGNGAPVATIEYTPNRNNDGTPGVQVLAWGDACAEEASDSINVENTDRF